MANGWTPRIGDPSPLGWITVVCYAVASFMCLRAASSEPDTKNIWRMLGMALILLGINKQLDLQSLLTQIGRDFARAGNWYDQRRQFQQLFVGAIAVASLFGTITLIPVLKGRSRAVRTASIGFMMLVAFVLIRAASFHHVDSFLKSALLGARLNWIIELSGIGLIGLAAFSAGRRDCQSHGERPEGKQRPRY